VGVHPAQNAAIYSFEAASDILLSPSPFNALAFTTLTPFAVHAFNALRFQRRALFSPFTFHGL
jgi:hypothetical protein